MQDIAAALLGKQGIPSVAEQLPLLDAVAGDEWWIDVTLAMLEVARTWIRGACGSSSGPGATPSTPTSSTSWARPPTSTCRASPRATEAFGHYLDRSRFTVDQIRFVDLIVDEVTANGVVEPRRLFESPYTDHAPTGPDYLFPQADVQVIVDILGEVKDRARGAGVA